ncbi:MAG: hypothetical protein RSP_11110 [Rhodanobacter sp.]
MSRQCTQDANSATRTVHHGRVAGFTLIELMVAMLLGLVVIGGVTSVFLANQQVYRTNAALGEVQDNTRVSFELLAQNIRQAGLLGCSNNGQVANVLADGPNNSGTDWWANWNNALQGFGSGTGANPALTVGTTAGQQVAGTDSLMLLNAADGGLSVSSNDPVGYTFTLNGTDSNFAANKIMIVCDPDHATLFRASSYTTSGASPVVGYAQTSGGGGATLNCSAGLGYPTVCTPAGTSYTFNPNAMIAPMAAGVWYVGYNPGGTTSLYLDNVDTTTGTATPQEMVRGVTAMAITYHVSGKPNFVTASGVSSWSSVDAVQVKLTMQSTSARVATNSSSGAVAAAPLQRSYTVTATVRNRVQ